MDLTLEDLRELTRRIPDYGWHRGKQETEVFWVSSLAEEGSFDAVEALMRYIRSKYVEIPVSVDLGSAEGLVVLLMHCCGFEAYGIEKVSERFEVSLQLRDELSLNEAVDLALGDWTTNEPYRQLGLSVEDIDFFYIFPSKEGGAEKAFELVGKRAKSGAVLAVNLPVEDPRLPVPHNLQLDRTFPCPVGHLNVYVKEVFEPLRFHGQEHG